MEQKTIEAAIKAVLEDPKVVSSLAENVAKQMIKNKSNPTNIEEELVRDHVIFGQVDSETAKFMTTKEITEEIHGFKPDLTIRPRIFGKALIAEAVKTKDSSAGRVYLVEAVVEKITEKVLEDIIKATPVKNDEEVPGEENPLTIDDLNDMDLSELLEVNENVEAVKKKKAKKMDADELRQKLIKAMDLGVDVSDVDFTEEKEEEKPEVDVALLIAAVNDYETLKDYKEHLDSMSKSKLIKHINKHKMPIVCENKDEEEIVESIVALIKENMRDEAEEEEEQKDEAKESKSTVVKKKDKKKKKDKNKKKKKKKSKD